MSLKCIYAYIGTLHNLLANRNEIDYSRFSKNTAGYRCRNIWIIQNVTSRNIIDLNNFGTWG